MLTYLTSLCECMVEKGQRKMIKSQMFIRATKDRKLRRVTIINLTSLCEWMEEKGQKKMVKSQKFLRATKDKRLWRVMIAQVLKGLCA